MTSFWKKFPTTAAVGLLFAIAMPVSAAAAELPQHKETELKETEKKSLVSNAKSVDQAQAYTRPGIVAFQGGEWVGSDHLYNLGEKLALVVETVSPANLTFTDSDLRQIMAKKLIASNFDIVPTDPGVSVNPPPFLHALIMVYPLGKQLVAYCGLRLFEPVELLRVKLSKEVAFQAITWERQTVIESNEDAFGPELKRALDDLLNTFIEQWKHFERQRAHQKAAPTTTKPPAPSSSSSRSSAPSAGRR